MIKLSIEEMNGRCDGILVDTYDGELLECSLGGENFDADYLCANRMINDGYVKLVMEVEGGGMYMYQITPSGRAFIGTGGYAGVYEREVGKAKRENRRYWITTWIAVGAAIVSILALLKDLFSCR